VRRSPAGRDPRRNAMDARHDRRLRDGRRLHPERERDERNRREPLSRPTSS
jgi:hypothetical protein